MTMKKIFLSLAALLLAACVHGAQPRPVPTVANLSYGPAKSNVLDLWQAKSDAPGAPAAPTPLVIFVHGGGFVAGDKAAISPTLVTTLLANGISVASINYRFRTDEPDGVFACLADVKYALQFLRYHAAEYNIDKTRVAMMGSSAGAGSTLWIAFHDDMADPAAADPVLRESTRISAGVANALQATYDLLQWPKLYGLDPSNEYVQVDANVLNFYGVKSAAELQTPEGLRKRAELDMLAMLTPDDPPVYVESNKPATMPPASRGDFLHHPIHVKLVYEKAQQVGVECIAVAPAYGMESKVTDVEFLIDKLTKK